MSRAYAPESSSTIHWVTAVAAWPAYLIVVDAWSTDALLCSRDGRALFTATPCRTAVGEERVRWRPPVGWAVGILAVIYALVFLAIGEVIASLSHWFWGWPGTTVEAVAWMALLAALILSVRPTRRSRTVRKAVARARRSVGGHQWDIRSFAAWPRYRGYGVELLTAVLADASLSRGGADAGAGASAISAWLTVRHPDLVPLYEHVGFRVVPGTDGRAMVIGATWRTAGATGSDTYPWVDEARSEDAAAWPRLIEYNEDDTAATHRLREHLRAELTAMTSSAADVEGAI